MLNEENLAALLVVQEFIHHRRVVAKTLRVIAKCWLLRKGRRKTKASWTAFLRQLRERGLKGVGLFVPD